MLTQVEAGRAAGRDRTSDVVLCRNASEIEQSQPINKQTAWLARRFNVGDAVARVLAEHAFNQGKLR